MAEVLDCYLNHDKYCPVVARAYFRGRIICGSECIRLEAWMLKTLKISDEAHAKLTSVVGRLMAETGKMKTYSDAIEAILNRFVLLPQELLEDVGNFIKSNAQLGYVTKEEFMQDAIRSKITSLSEQKTSTGKSKRGRLE